MGNPPVQDIPDWSRVRVHVCVCVCFLFFLKYRLCISLARATWPYMHLRQLHCGNFYLNYYLVGCERAVISVKAATRDPSGQRRLWGGMGGGGKIWSRIE